jgi:hypothetical protein
VRDGPALYGIISLLESLGLELIEIRPLTGAMAATQPTFGRSGDLGSPSPS